MQTLEELRAVIADDWRLRDYVRLEHGPNPCPGGPVEQVGDALLVAHDFRAIGRLAWQPLTDVAAAKLATQLLSQDLAYAMELVPKKTATFLAGELVKTLAKHAARFAATGSIDAANRARWMPIGTATFEIALVGFDATQAFLLYASAED